MGSAAGKQKDQQTSNSVSVKVSANAKVEEPEPVLLDEDGNPIPKPPAIIVTAPSREDLNQSKPGHITVEQAMKERRPTGTPTYCGQRKPTGNKPTGPTGPTGN